MNKTKGSFESEISKAVTKWEKDYLGRGPISVKSDILRDMIIVTLNGILTPAEYKLCKDREGITTIKRTRTELVESGVEELKEVIFTITGKEIVSFHTDLSTRTGERIMVFKVSNGFDEKR
ncbi:DUF2294 domain-containing protein [Halalkalibacter hemicellulosilyticus]|uniref:Na+-translocating membrane potential-generating system MpsC domain-containing protein n=1 Tax=Halalkalibacter hemicellulosilyticusJCM 9152 TaxID=1236971 RepID=W4QBH7_9BACI|nr:DUF2294 domain-containing protein [Halalkalibacter hemicellulosilyticus]GAE29370.1 hypothetical protein JCM9152_723 [Halalkalibacter hemicellulosilyticusJCM 9152]